MFAAKSAKGFGIHSPFAYNFVSKVLNNKNKYKGIDKIEMLRSNLLKSEEVIEVEDFGAGSMKMKNKIKKINEITKYSVTTKKNGMLLYNLTQYFDFKNIIELGTSLGIGTSYISISKKDINIFTIEGSEKVFEIANKNFQLLDIKNIKTINAKFEEVLITILEKIKTVDFVFVDGNHKKESTLKYFYDILSYCKKESVILFDDIRWNKDMLNTWNTIINHKQVTISFDLFFQGIVFVNDDFTKKHYKIRY